MSKNLVETVTPICNEILGVLEEGGTLHAALRQTGVRPSTWYSWMKRVEGLKERYESAYQQGAPFRKGALIDAAEQGLVKRLLGYYVQERQTTIHPDGTETITIKERFVDPNPAVNFRVLQGLAPDVFGQPTNMNQQMATVVNIVAPSEEVDEQIPAIEQSVFADPYEDDGVEFKITFIDELPNDD